MALGAVNTILVCTALSTGPSVAPCVDMGGVSYAPQQVESYVLDSAASSYVDSLAVPFDVTMASGFFTFGFVGVVSLWFLGKTARLVLVRLGIMV